MSARISEVTRGDKLVWTPGDQRFPVYIEVTRVARDKTWADIRCCSWASEWTKRQPMPLPTGTERRGWTQQDIDDDAERARRRLDGSITIRVPGEAS